MKDLKQYIVESSKSLKVTAEIKTLCTKLKEVNGKISTCTTVKELDDLHKERWDIEDKLYSLIINPLKMFVKTSAFKEAEECHKKNQTYSELTGKLNKMCGSDISLRITVEGQFFQKIVYRFKLSDSFKEKAGLGELDFPDTYTISFSDYTDDSQPVSQPRIEWK